MYKTKEQRRKASQGRALARFFAGASYEKLLLVTLTTPEQFDGDLHRAWRLFTWRLRKRGLFRRYYAVKEWNEKRTCEHLHVVFQTRSELEARAIRHQWSLAVRGGQAAGASGEEAACLPQGDYWTKHEWARDRGKMGAYLAKYLNKAIDGSRSYWYSLWWVFPGFARWGKGLWSLGVERAERLAWGVRSGAERPTTAIFRKMLEGSHFLDRVTGELITARSIKAVEAALEPYKLLERGLQWA